MSTTRAPYRTHDLDEGDGRPPPRPIRRTVRYDRPLTVEEFAALPESPDGFRRELVRGEVVEVAPTGYLHGAVQPALAEALRVHVRAHGGRALGTVLTETGFIVDPEGDVPVRGPDVAFLEASERPPRSRRGFLPGTPILAVEIKSPYDLEGELEAKAAVYLRAGDRLVWVIAPPDDEASAEAARLGGAQVWRPDAAPRSLGPDGVLDGEDVLPGFRITVSDLWAEA